MQQMLINTFVYCIGMPCARIHAQQRIRDGTGLL